MFLLTMLFMFPIMAAGLSLIVGMGQIKGLPIFTVCQLVLTALCILLMWKLGVFDKEISGLKTRVKGFFSVGLYMSVQLSVS